MEAKDLRKPGWLRLRQVGGVLMAATVSSCGGGGGGGSDPPLSTPGAPLPLSINTQNAVRVTADAFYAIDTVVTGAVAPLYMMNVTTGPCAFGGKLEVTLQNNDSEPNFSPGDTLTVVATECAARHPDQSISAPMTTNGTLVITGLTRKNGTVAGTGEASWSTRYDQYAINEGERIKTLDGEVSFATKDTQDTNSVSIKATTFSFTEGTAKNEVPVLTIEVLADNKKDTTTEYYEGLLPTQFGRVEIDTISPLVGLGMANPSSGQVELFTENSGIALIPHEDGVNVDVQVDTNGDGTPEETLSHTWVTLGW